MAVCLYCGNNHAAHTCSSRYVLAIDPFSPLKVVLRRRRSESKCVVCLEPLTVGGLEVVQIKKANGAFVQAMRAHKVCFDEELERKVNMYLIWVSDRAEQLRETNRRKAQERYRRSKECAGS